MTLLKDGVVYLVGAGPGDPGLLTRRGAELLATADVVVHDGLVAPAVLALIPAEVEQVYAGKKRSAGGQALAQDEIEALLVARARRGQRVVRLKGGDPFVFGRGAEECLALAAAGVRFEIVPGVSAMAAVPAYAGIPLTERGLSSTVAFATGHEAEGAPSGDIDWAALARAGTVVLFMALKTVDDSCARLVAAGRAPTTPAAMIRWGTTAEQEVVRGTLATLPARVAAVALRPPALLVVGEVAAERPALDWRRAQPLGGVRLVVTRAAAAGDELGRLVADRGGELLPLPVTRIEPIAATAERRAAFARLAEYRWIAFASAHAVDHFFAELAARALDARALHGARLACVGPATVAALARHGLRADLMPPHGTAVGLADALLALGPLAGQRVLLPRAAGGRDEAADRLAAAGAVVDSIALYAAVPIAAAELERTAAVAKLRAGNVAAIVFYAPSQVSALWDGLADAAALVRGPLVAAIGPTTRAALLARGVAVDVTPASPEPGRLLDEIAAALATRRSDVVAG